MTQSRLDNICDALFICQNLIIPKSQNDPPLFIQCSCATFVSLIFVMLSTISLDHQPIFNTSEVGNIGFYRMLAAELVP